MHVEELVKIDLLTRRTVPNEGEETVEELHFFYDAQSRPAMVEYGGQLYSYLHNLQGDIIGIVDAAGSLVVEYRYDAWGKPIYEAGNLLSTLGNLNPFRYRGYVWDEEIGLYYLGSRFYNANIVRFLNSDCYIRIQNDTKGLLGQNAFLYCDNSPINYIDKNGKIPQVAVDGMVHDLVLEHICNSNSDLTWHGTCIYYNQKNFWNG